MAKLINAAELELQEQLVVLNRVSKTVKGGSGLISLRDMDIM